MTRRDSAIARRDDSALDNWYTPARSLFREFDDMRRSFDRMFGGLLASPWADPYSTGGTVGAAFDLYEDKDSLRLTVELPGMEQKDVDVSVTSDSITISGERAQEDEGGQEGAYHFRRTSSGSFSRSFRLPVEIDADGAKATMKNGILKLVLPKAQVAKARTVKVESE